MTILDPPGGAPGADQYDDDEFDDELIEGTAHVARTQWQLFRRRFFRHKGAMLGLFILVVMCVCCYGATWVAPFPKNHQDLLFSGDPGPSWHHLFGVDQLGRDYFSEVLFAGQISLTIGLAVGLLSTVVGTAIGAVAGYYGSWRDAALMRLTDLFLVVPSIAILAIALIKLGTSTLTIVIAFSGLFWMTIARIVRGEVLALKEKEFVEAARAAGASDTRIILRTILPNLVGPIAVNATLGVALAIGTESTLSFLGFGVQRPSTSWGNMLSDARGYVSTPQAFLIYFPGLMLLLVTLAVNFLGDGLRDALDPQGEDA
jgi:peptide/nickel transport system permease protein